MKKHLSVFMLVARSTIYKVSYLFILMMIAEVGLFYTTFLQSPFGEDYGLELVLKKSHIVWIFVTAFLLLTALLCTTGFETSSKQGYTLMRLSISEKWVLFWQSIYNIICYLLLWSVQILIVFALCQLYIAKASPAHITSQTIFLAFYRNHFLHFLLPFEDFRIWLVNLLPIIGCGIGFAYLPYAQRKRLRQPRREVNENET